MGKKIFAGILAGLAGAGAYAAFKNLTQDQKDRFREDFYDKMEQVRDRAVDYAFYADDDLNDAKEVLNDQVSQFQTSAKSKSEQLKQRVHQAKAKATEAEKRAEGSETDKAENDQQPDPDIILTAEEALKKAKTSDELLKAEGMSQDKPQNDLAGDDSSKQ